jgi:predicted PurR-regulated permease PerM
VQVALTLVVLFFLLRDTPRLMPVVREFIPLNAEQTDALLRRVVETIHATVYGATAVAVAQGALTGLAFWFLGLPAPLLWTAVTTVLCFVPLLGAPVVWVPTVIVLAAQGAYGKAFALSLWGLLVVGLVDNFIRPIVIGARTQLHPMVVFFSVLGGLLLMGPLGLLMGPVILAITIALLEILKLKLAEGEKSNHE